MSENAHVTTGGVPQGRRPYVAPTVRKWGSIEELTRGGTEGGQEGATPSRAGG
jgi:hypothetical protein